MFHSQIPFLKDVIGKKLRSFIWIGLIGLTGWSWNYFWINRRLYRSSVSLKGKTIIITGATSGIGYEAAKDLVKRGARVILACRNMSKGELCRKRLMENVGCDGKDIVLMACDLSSLRSVKNFAEIYLSTEERLDALICNAGLGRSSTKFTENKFDQVIQANYLGHVLLIDLLKDKLEECRPSRVIHVSSELHKIVRSIPDEDWPDLFYQERNRSWFGSYPHSKLFQILSTHYCKEIFLEKGINMFSMTPGWVSTSMEDPMEPVISVYFRWLYRSFTSIMKFFFAKTPFKGSETIIYCVIEPSLELSKEIFFENCQPGRTSELAKDFRLAERLWTFTQQMLAVSVEKIETI